MSVQKLSKGWRVRWRPDGVAGPQRSRDFAPDEEAEARAFDANLKVRKKVGRVGPSGASTMRVDAFAQEWFVDWAEVNLAEKTKIDYADLWDRHLLRRVGHLSLAKASRPAVWARLRQELERDGVGAPTIRKALGLAQAMFREAVLWDYLEANPLKDVPKPTAGRKRAVLGLAPIWCEVVRQAMLDRMVGAPAPGRRSRGKPVFVPAPTAAADALLACLIFYAGLRPGEALALEWERVLDRTVVIDAAIALGAEKATKNRRNRSVNLLGPLKADVDRYRLAQGRPAKGLVLPRPKDGKAWQDEDYRNWRSRVWHSTRDDLGLGRGRPYDGRHAFGSLLLHEGRSLAYVAQQMGDTIETVSTTYLHVIDELAGSPPAAAEDTIRAARERVVRDGVRKVCGGLRQAEAV